MRLFSGDTGLFIEKAINNEIAATLTTNFQRFFGYRPGESEIKSWTVSLKDLAQSVRSAGLSDCSVIVEYRLPLSSKRIDVMLLGKGQDQRHRGVELAGDGHHGDLGVHLDAGLVACLGCWVHDASPLRSCSLGGASSCIRPSTSSRRLNLSSASRR